VHYVLILYSYCTRTVLILHSYCTKKQAEEEPGKEQAELFHLTGHLHHVEDQESNTEEQAKEQAEEEQGKEQTGE
jgi:hypothetical protein